jgi:GDP-4-dehydro-6-deoxy-D-mannose reductase
VTTALITGASGFAGRHLVAELERATNWEIVGVGRSRASIGSRTQVLACDLRDANLIRRNVERFRPSVVFHLAAQSYVPKAIAAPAETLTNNLVAQVNLLEACRDVVPDATIVVVCSAEEYGFVEPDEVPVTEDQPFRPGNPYAVSKIAQDMLAYQYARSSAMRIIRLRPFNHFGPGQSDRFVLSSFARQIADAEAGRIEPCILAGNLGARRDFLDVRDVVRAYRLAAEHSETRDVYNLATGQAWMIGDLLDQLRAMARIRLSVRQDPARMRPSDVPILSGDASKFRRLTGWEPEISITQSLQDLLDDWRRRLGRE